MAKDHSEECPSCATVETIMVKEEQKNAELLSHWPIQIKLIGTVAPFLNDAEMVVAADCTAFAVKDFHTRFLKGRKLLIGCPKLDNAQYYLDKFTEIFSNIPIKSVSCLRMQVPCCGGITAVLTEALKRAEKDIPFDETVIGVKGEILSERTVH